MAVFENDNEAGYFGPGGLCCGYKKDVPVYERG